MSIHTLRLFENVGGCMKVATKILLPMCGVILLGMAAIAYMTYGMSSDNMHKAQQELNVMAVNNTISELKGIHEFNVVDP